MENQKIVNVDKYSLDQSQVLGCGQIATVYVGWETSKPDVKYAIKQQCFEQLQKYLGDKYIKFIGREVKTMKAVQNENIVKIYDVKLTNKHFYLVMELCENGNLAQKLKNSPNHRIPEPEAIQIFKQIMSGYSAINTAKALHRDLKPENILFKGNVTKIADFGLAKIIENNDSVNQKVTVTGTPYYRPPQLLTVSQQGVDIEFPQKIDIWSLGVLFYEMLMGRRPWMGEQMVDFLDQIENKEVEFPAELKISEQTQDLILNMLTIDEKYRFSFEDCLEHPFFKN